MRKLRAHSGYGLLLVISAISVAGPAFADTQPQDWLNRMGAAVQSTSYQGTVIRTRNGSAEALKVVHTIKDGVIMEKVVAQEGNGLEIIRHGNEVHCILPDRKSVLVEQWDDQSTLFSSLPSSNVSFGSEYDISIVREERIAGREAMLLAIRPHDGYRYGHRLWLDIETGFPLQTQLISDGDAIEEVKFADITLNQEIHASAFEPTISTENFTWLTQPSAHQSTDVVTSWMSDQLPAGFKVVSMHEETMDDDGDRVTHMLFSDGLANVSVFIAASSGEFVGGPAQVGGSNSYSVQTGDFEVTAIGEVPAMTVEQIATTMRLP